MTSAAESTRLLAEFPAHTYEQWHAAAEALLKGASFDKRLVSSTPEGIVIQPIHRREDIAGLPHCGHLPGVGSRVRGSRAEGFLDAGWEVSQELRAATPAALNGLVREGLAGGQSELNLVVDCGCHACRSGGVALQTAADVEGILDGVVLDAVSVWWQSGPCSLAVAALHLAAAERLGFASDRLRGGFEDDPFAELLCKGGLRQSLAARFDRMAALTAHAAKHAPGLRTITATGDIHHNAGATATQELGHVIATVVAYVEAMKARGVEPRVVLPRIRLRLAVGSDYFMEIAKIRAARWLWSKVADAYGVPDAPVHIHASTSRWNKTVYDAHTNMLRVTAEAFAAVVAGADSLHIGPYDEIACVPDAFSRRIARNLHAILREECGLDRVIDPAGGAYSVEWLTDRVAERGWAVFQDIEARGGMGAAVLDGSVQKAVAAVRAGRFDDIRRRKQKIVGANVYPDLKGARLGGDRALPACEGPPSAPCDAVAALSAWESDHMVAGAIDAAKAGAGIAAIETALAREGPLPMVQPLTQHRAAEEYEALRDASAAFAARTGARPAILQLNLGPSRRYRLRADWTAAFFEAAGFAVDGAHDFETPEAAVEALVASPAMIAVMTSDDATYLAWVEPLAVAAKAAKPGVFLLVAGTAPDAAADAAWRAAGVDEFVHVRSNNHDLNQRLLHQAGVM